MVVLHLQSRGVGIFQRKYVTSHPNIYLRGHRYEELKSQNGPTIMELSNIATYCQFIFNNLHSVIHRFQSRLCERDQYK
jgi:hypothetical protein